LLKLTDDEFIKLWAEHKSAVTVAKAMGIDDRSVHRRRRRIEERYGIALEAEHRLGAHYAATPAPNYAIRQSLGIENGVVLVMSDAHYWPGMRSTAHKALLWATREMQPKAVIANGDCFDGAAISRHPRIGWQSPPSPRDELGACEAMMSEIEDAATLARRNAKLVWTLGNHDSRFESRLSNSVPEFRGVKGFTLRDHFPAWEICWSAWPTDNVVVKHRLKGGVHAAHNNTVGAGKSIVTGHLHSLKVTPYSDYNGTRFGVDTGTLAEPSGPQFADYLEDNPVNWRSGFAVLTFHKGRLLWPELVHVIGDGAVDFRGAVVNVSKY
jgi:predicted phosphodiesterase